MPAANIGKDFDHRAASTGNPAGSLPGEAIRQK